MFNQGMWNKDHALWVEVQKANWDDVILKQQFKDAMRKDIKGFFDSEDLYKSLAIPWKVTRYYDLTYWHQFLTPLTAWCHHVWPSR